MTFALRRLDHGDWSAVERIYAEGIATGLATFESTTPSAEAFHATRIAALGSVAEQEGVVVGWVAASPVSARAAYRGVVEHSVYVAQEARGGGIGEALLRRLLQDAEARGVWTVQSSIIAENVGSIRLHERVGYRVVGVRERIGRTPDGVWHDTVLVERRSALP
ncbi:GNAT family N-acetyltransferase [Agrococcus sp. SGAir0287]|uniref:GNAT family N-acetyltransferase n=1 Tax=Agrococcus sp. SGAir0287 TaxID=2070347 RepID=UPI0010CCDB2A|nr:GNAT family N-acetyltransferase [Agrococcus sp. SGAir0287]QCR18054.1 N-acetyltransferase [Agrococcus sp. SGAir0287]